LTAQLYLSIHTHQVNKERTLGTEECANPTLWMESPNYAGYGISRTTPFSKPVGNVALYLLVNLTGARS